MMKTTVLCAVLVIASAGSAARAAPLHLCGAATAHDYARIEAILDDSRDLRLLRADPSARREAVAAGRGAIAVARVVRALELRISRRPALALDPRVRHMMCFASRAMHDYSRAMRLALTDAQRAARHRSAIDLSRGGVGPAAGSGSLSQQPITITHSMTHDRERSHTLERSHAVSEKATRSRSYERSVSRAIDADVRLAREYSSRVDASASDGYTVTAQQTLLCPPQGCPSTVGGMEAEGLCGATGPVQCIGRGAVPRLSPPSRAQAERVIHRSSAAARAARGAADRSTAAQARASADLRAQRRDIARHHQ